MKRKKLLGLLIAICITTSLVFALSTPGFAATTGTPVLDPNAKLGTVTKVAVTFYGDSTTSKGFTWYTSAASVKSNLQIVEKTSDSADFTKADVIKFDGTCSIPTNLVSSTITKTQEYLHKAEAKGLKPNTTYFFRVGDESTGLWSEIGTVQTAPQNGAFTFLDLADPQAKELDESILSANTFKQAIATVPDAKFIALNGDIVDNGSSEYQWDWLFNNMSQVMLNTTIAPIAGNHESQTNTFIDHFNLLPASGSPTTSGVYYSYDYSNAHFVMLNTNENSTSWNDFTQAQVDWMKADIQAAKEKGQWIITILHKGPYTTSNHATDSDISGAAGVRKMIAPIFANLGVDLVLQGHDHIYARSMPIKADGTADTENIISDYFNGQNMKYEVNPNGSVYLIPSTAGPKVYYKNKKISDTTPLYLPTNYYNLFDNSDESHSAIYGQDPNDATRPLRSMVDNFESIRIDGNRLSVISYEIDHGGLLHPDETPYIIDSFGLLKDNTKPTITVDGINDGDIIKLNEKKNVTWSAADEQSGSGIKTASGDITSGSSIDTSEVGLHTLNFTATDNAGNKTSKSIKYTVQYDYSGILSPINKDGSSTFKVGSTIPVKFQLKDAAGTYIPNATTKLYIAKVTENNVETEFNATSTSSNSDGNIFKYDESDNQYIFNLRTKELTSGTYQLRIDLGDGTTNTVKINLK